MPGKSPPRPRRRAGPQLIQAGTVDRQSPQYFARWGRTRRCAPLELSHQPVRDPDAGPWSRAGTTAPGSGRLPGSCASRCRAPRSAAPQWSRLRPVRGRGPHPSCRREAPRPRLYSLASGPPRRGSSRSSAKQPGGLCSSQLTALTRPPSVATGSRRGWAPRLLIGAGHFAPLVVVRGNRRHRPIHPVLDWCLSRGQRHLYGRSLHAAWDNEGRLGPGLVTAVARAAASRLGTRRAATLPTLWPTADSGPGDGSVRECDTVGRGRRAGRRADPSRLC